MRIGIFKPKVNNNKQLNSLNSHTAGSNHNGNFNVLIILLSILCYCTLGSLHSDVLASEISDIVLHGTVIGNVEVIASNSITLDIGFYAVEGCIFYAHIDLSQGPDSTLIAIESDSRNEPSTGTKTKNFISEITFREAKLDFPTDSFEHSQNITYFDGIGRPIQTVEVGASPLGNDLIQPVLYDYLGREAIKPLHYAATERTGMFRSGVTETTVNNYYSSSAPEGVEPNNRAYAQINFENSPLNRVISQTGPGTAWVDKPVVHNYLTNDTSIPGWTYNSDGSFYPYPYAPYSLFITEVIDEQGNVTREYKDMQGRIAQKSSLSGDQWFRTFYIYDDLGLLHCVVPPKASGTADTNLCYYYKYDTSHRMIEKWIPGGGKVKLIYDSRDRLRCSQNSNQSEKNEWSFTKYDNLNRPVITGTVIYPGNIGDALANDSINETRISNLNNFGYSNYSFPKTGTSILTTTYYDDYVFITDLELGDSLSCSIYDEGRFNYSQKFDHSPKNRVTGGMVKILSPLGATVSIADTLLFSTNYYDKYGHLLRSISENHLKGKDVVSNNYEDITFQVLLSKHQHFKGIEIDSLLYAYEYDSNGRLVSTLNKVNTQSATTLNALKYNETGQMVSKYLHSNQITGNRSFLQKVDYTYNIRGWMTKINDPSLSEDNDLFGMQLCYENNSAMEGLSGSVGYYNGNISGIKWTIKDEVKKGYIFSYDSLNRMKDAEYAEGSTLGSGQGYYSEKVTSYDKNGNILALQRMYHDTLVDDLTYKYFDNSNRVEQINDILVSNVNVEDYPGPSSDYHYDSNGNMTTDGSRNISIVYHSTLNIPGSVDFGNDNRINYYYSASGAKLIKQVLPDNEIESKTEYVGSYVYENNKLSYILTSEGRLIPVGSGEDRRFVHEYNLKDHLGNNRVTFMGTDLGGSVDVVQTTNYYPFGLVMTQSNTSTPDYSKNKYLYNGKEIQDDKLNGTYFGLLDYGSRYYDPQIGRWHSIDPSAESYDSWTPYNYALNNPIFFIDPNGEDVYLFYYLTDNHKKGEEDEESNRAFWAAALTRANDMLKNGEIGEGDKAIFKGISSTDEIQSTIEGDVAANKDQFGATKEVGIWSHGGFDGPFRENKNGSIDQKPVSSWGDINFNWVQDGGKFGFYGCRTGKDPDNREGGRREGQSDKPFAQQLSGFSNMNSVEVWGQTQRSWPSPYTNVRVSTSSIKNGNHQPPTYFVGSVVGSVTNKISNTMPTYAYPMAVYKNGQFVGFRHQPGATY